MEKIKLIYILAASHSGSTLTAMLLGANPNICTVGELKITHLGDPEKYRCACGEPIKKCRFWNLIVTAMQKQGVNYELGKTVTNISSTENRYIKRFLRPQFKGKLFEYLRDCALFFSPQWHTHLRFVQKNNTALMRSLREVSGKQFIVDSSKVAIRLKYLLRNRDIDIKVVRLIRDGRAVALTYMDPYNFADASKPELRAGGFGGNRDGQRMSMKKAAYEWLFNNREAEYMLRQLDRKKWIEIHYEDICLKTDVTLQKISDFIGIDTISDYKNFRRIPQHVVGNGMRLDTGSEIQLDERWKKALSPEDLKVFDNVAGTLNRKYGYT